jgi:hypothetical protein
MSDIVNRGTSGNDPNADTLYEAFGKINNQFGSIGVGSSGTAGSSGSTGTSGSSGSTGTSGSSGSTGTSGSTGSSGSSGQTGGSGSHGSSGTAGSSGYGTYTYGTVTPVSTPSDGDIYFQYEL